MALDVLHPANMNCELLATCSALGYLEGNKYEKEPDCLETIKDLIRFLRREDEKCNIRRQLGHAQILQNDLIPLTKQYYKDEELFETTTRLLVNLTQPAELCFQNVPDDKTFRNYFLEVLSHLQAYKQAFACEEFMSVLAKKMKKLLDMEWESRREDHTLLMERILLLIRNVLHIPADPNEEKRTDDDASVHDQVLWALNVSGMDKLILYIASAEGEQQWCMHAIEIISHMLREQTPEVLAKTGVAQQASERLKEERELEMLRQRELAEKKARLLKASARHSRFGGSFYMKNFKSISEKDLIYHKPLHQAKSISFEGDKGPTKKPKNRMPIRDSSVNRRSTLSIRIFLKDFCVLFIENCYNPLMYNVKDHILHRRAQENDESYYLWAMQFFMHFSRLYKFRVDVISETFSVQAFHYVNTQITKYLDMMTTEKKEAAAWAKRMHLGVKAYRELLATLNEMTGLNSPPELRESGDVMQGNVFYVVEYREIFVTLLKKYDEVRSTRAFLRDLIECAHIFIKMLEKYSKGRSTLMVQKKTKKRAKRRKRRQQPQQEEQLNQNQEQEEQLTYVWDNTLSGELSAMLQDREDAPDDVVPFDAASEQPVEEQRADAMVRIQQSLRSGKAGEGLALFRAAREVWPDGDVFGAADIDPEEEFMALREIHFTNLNVPAPAEQAEPDMIGEQEEEEEDEEDEMAMEDRMERGEEEFNFKLFINKFSHPDVLKSYIKLLTSYRSNQELTNHCVIKILHRIAVECDKTQLLFQASLFRIFHKILLDPLAKTDQFKEMSRFAQYVVGHFFKELPSNPKLVVELLFWKDARGVYEIQEGYGAEMPSKKSAAKEWSEEEQAELAGLFEQYRDVDGGDKDVVDMIMERLIDDTKTRRQIITQLVKQELVDSARDLKKTKGAKRVTLWREEQELELRTLFNEHRESGDVVGAILEHISVKRSRNKVMQKILEMGLVQDRKQLYKKRRRKRDEDGEKPRRRTRRRGDDEGEEEELEFADGLQEFPDSEAEYMTSTDESGKDDDDDEDDDEESEGGEDGEETSLDDLIAKAQRKGLTSQLGWIQEGLRRTAEDRENGDESQAIPIVPLSDEHHTAMRNKTFQNLLKKAGLSEPRSHEEVYWRIPGELTANQLREMADSIQPKEGAEAPTTEEGPMSSKKSSARFQMLKQLALSRREDKKEKKRSAREERSELRNMTMETSDEPQQSMADLYEVETDVSGDDDDEVGGRSSPKSADGRGSKGKVSRIKRSLPSDSSSEDSDDENLTSFKAKEAASQGGKPAKRSRLVSSDESENEDKDDDKIDEEEQILPKSRSFLSDDDDSSEDEVLGRKKAGKQPVEKSKNILSDDDGDSDGEVLGRKKADKKQTEKKKSAVKRQKIVESDESDEEEDEGKKDEEAEAEDDADIRSEIFELDKEPRETSDLKRKRPLKKQTPFDISDEEEEKEEEAEEDVVGEKSLDQDTSLNLRLSEDSPSDVEMASRGAVTTEDDMADSQTDLPEDEDNAANFKLDSTSNVADDNVDNYLDNKNEEEEGVEEVAEAGDEMDGEWEEVFDDDSDVEMTPSNQTTATDQPGEDANPMASSDSDSDDDVPLRKVAKRQVVSSDSEDE